MAKETITISSVASPELQIVTIDSDSNEPTIPYGFGNQHPIVPHSLNDLNLPPNQFIVLATMAVVRPNKQSSPKSPKPSNPSAISTPNEFEYIESWETAHTSTDDKTFYSNDEPRRVFRYNSLSEIFDSNEPRHASFASSPSSTPPHPRQEKSTLSMGMTILEKKSVAAHLRGIRPAPTSKKDNLVLKKNSNTNTNNQTLNCLL